MTEANSSAPEAPGSGSLVSRRTVRVSPGRVFALWTEPAHLLAWWGPRDVDCVAAEVDARTGGRYRIGNRFPDGRIVWIEGTFERVNAPHELVYSWHLHPDPTGGRPSRVTVRFEPCAEGTEVIVRHERLAERALRERTGIGWRECLAALAAYVARSGEHG